MNIAGIIISAIVGSLLYLILSKDNWLTRLKEAQKRGEKTPEMEAAEADAREIVLKIKTFVINVWNYVTKKIVQLRK